MRLRRRGRRVVAARRSNSQRSAEMQHRILRATVECLLAEGYAATTTTMVAHRARVSRGAFLHHFRIKEDLVLAAVEHLFDLRQAEFRAAFAHVPENADRPAAALDLLWRMIGGDTFYAWLELAIAGRTDARLGKKVRELGSRTAARRRADLPRAVSQRRRRRTRSTTTRRASPSHCCKGSRSIACSSRRRACTPKKSCRSSSGSPCSPFSRRRSAMTMSVVQEIPVEEARHRARVVRGAAGAPVAAVGQQALRVLSRHRLGRARVPHRRRPTRAGSCRATDPLGGTAWYRALPADRARARRPLSRGDVHEGRAAVRERAQPGPSALRAVAAASSSPEQRYAYHELIEESHHSMMFAEFVRRSGFDVPGLSRNWTRLDRIVVSLGANFPELFFVFVLGGEDPIDHAQRLALARARQPASAGQAHVADPHHRGGAALVLRAQFLARARAEAVADASARSCRSRRRRSCASWRS